MTAAAVEHEAERSIRELLTQGVEKELQAYTIGMRQEQHEAATAARFDRRVQPQPAVLMLMNPRRPLAKRTPQPSVCYFETKTSFIEGQNMLDLKLSERWTELLF